MKERIKMKYFLDSAKLDEIQYAYNTFGIDGVTTNPRHIMLSGKPFMKAITDIAEWIKSVGLEGIDKFPVSVEINPHLDDADEMVEMAKGGICDQPPTVIKIPAVESGITAARRLEKMGIRTDVTLVSHRHRPYFRRKTVPSSYPRSSDGRRPMEKTAGDT